LLKKLPIAQLEYISANRNAIEFDPKPVELSNIPKKAKMKFPIPIVKNIKIRIS
jgi:hypothetical protein